MKENKIEILSPAGNYETFVCAVKSGADAVYIGGQSFNARKNAANFSNEEILSAVEYAHIHSVKVYVTLNTIVSDMELKEVYEFIDFLYNAGVDALIIQDLAVLDIVKKYFPDFEVHASTQMTICNLEGAKIAQKLGFKRVVLSRELTFEQIKYISENTDIELEVFVHGALCMSYSGQCLMSSFIGSRSGNRGACAQPCRLAYTLYDEDGRVLSDKEKYLLSLKDLCLADEIQKLISCGVTSLKIEGRMKSSDYVSIVTSVYNKYRLGGQVSQEDMSMLENIFSRNGFTKGYLYGKTGRHMLNYDKNNDDVYLKVSDSVKETANRLKSVDMPKVSFDAKAYIKLFEPMTLTVSAMGHSVTVVGNIKSEKALNVPLTEDRLISQLSKTGSTEFELNNVWIYIDESVSLPVKEINEVRREALKRLLDCITKVERNDSKKPFVMPSESINSDKTLFLARVLTKEQALASKQAGFDKILCPYNLYIKEKEYLKSLGIPIGVVLPSVASDGTKIDFDEIDTEVYATNIAHVSMAERFEMRADFTLNLYNSVAFGVLKDLNIKSACVSCEANLKEIKNFKSPIGLEVVVYGKIPLMTVKNCVVKSALGRCNCKDTPFYLKDRKGIMFPLFTDGRTCTNTIYNSTPIYMADKLKDITNKSIEAYHFAFTDEKSHEIKDILNKYKSNQKTQEPFTRGHYYRGV